MRRCLCNEDNNNSNILNVSQNITNNNCCNREESLLDNLCRFLGNRCIFEFVLPNSEETEEIAGILDSIGCDYLTIRTSNNKKIICTADNLLFVTIL